MPFVFKHHMKITVKVPATSANLGPGFDALGLALDLWNEAEFATADSFSLTIQGEGLGPGLGAGPGRRPDREGRRRTDEHAQRDSRAVCSLGEEAGQLAAESSQQPESRSAH